MAPHALVVAATAPAPPAAAATIVPLHGCRKNVLWPRSSLARRFASPSRRFQFPPECSSRAWSNDGSWWWAGGSSRILHRWWMVLVRSLVLLLITLLSAMAALHLRGRARFYVESRLLPPIASMLGAQLGRQVELGVVRGLWPLGISLGPCSIGPHDQEFSCGESTEVRIRIRPLRSIRRRRLTADVVLTSPVLLVSQKDDWTWLGLPDKPCKPSIDQQADARATARRIAKDAAAARLAAERHRAAWTSAQLGYRLPPVASASPVQSEVAEVAQVARPAGFWSSLWATLWVKDHTRQPSLEKMESILHRSAAKASISLDPSRAAARPAMCPGPGRPLTTETAPVDLSSGIDLDTVFFRDANLLLLAYGDNEARLMEQVNGRVTFASSFQQIGIQLQGRPRAWKAALDGDDASLKLTVNVDLREPKWHMKLSVRRLCAPLVEKLLELPLDWHRGSIDGEVEAWMDKGDSFPSFGGTLNVRNLSFTIWEAPAAFKELKGMLFLQGQRAFLHNTTGYFGAIPLSISGDMDLDPEAGEYRLSCQVPGIEANALMESLKVRPLPFSLAGAVKAVVYCRGPLEAPIFEGSGETLRDQLDLAFAVPPSVALDTIQRNLHRGALAAYDHVAFTWASASFTFNTNDCMANIYGIRASPVGGGEIRGAGDMWICPEAEADPTAIRIDCSGYVSADDILTSYAQPRLSKLPELALFGLMQGEAKIRGSLLAPMFDIKWIIPDAKGPFNGARGEVSISEEAVCISSSAPAFDISARLFTSLGQSLAEGAQLENIDLDTRLRSFDAVWLSSVGAVSVLDTPQLKISGRVKFQGRVRGSSDSSNLALSGDVSMWNLRLNQLLVASFLTGSLELSKSSVKLSATGRGKDRLLLQASGGRQNLEFFLRRGQLQIDLLYLAHSFAKWEVHGLMLDELELSSLRGLLQKVDVRLDLQKRRGQARFSVRRPRFSGIHGESLDLSARWSGDVVTLEKSVFEQANSRYELQGEYVFPGRERGKATCRAEGGSWHKAMAGQLGNVMASLGRWRLRLEVPRAELLDMLPVARLLSRSSDPTIVSRSKELFLQSVEKGAFIANTLRQEIEFIRSTFSTTHGDNAPGSESEPLPGLADLNGRWHGALEASGGGDGDITANFDLHGESWTWGPYNIQKTIAAGSYSSADGLHFEKAFLQKDTATFHADGTILGPSSNLHFALLNFPVQQLVPPLMQAIQSSSVEPLISKQHRALVNGILHMEGDLRGDRCRPEYDVQVRLLDGAIGGVNLDRAEVSASVVASRQFIFEARLEPAAHAGYVHVKGSVPLFLHKLNAADEEGNKKQQALQSEAGLLHVDATIKDSGMLLLTAVTPNMNWLQGNADMRLQIRGTFEQPRIESSAVFQKVAISSPLLPRPISNLGGTVLVKNNDICVQNMEGRVGKRGRVLVNGRLPLKSCENGEGIELKADMLEVRARNIFSGQVDGHVWITGCLHEPEATGKFQLSHGEAYLSQERSVKTTNSAISHLSEVEIISEDGSKPRLPVAIRLKGLKLQLGPELRMVYPLILNFAVLGELELHGYADADQIKPKGVLKFENGDVNLFATQVRLNKDYVNQARFEPEQGLDPNLDLALVGVHWQLKVQGRAQNWQDSLILSSGRSGEQDALTRSEAAKLFENQLLDSLLEGNGQLAFKKLAAATVETLMPKIETKGEFGQARWRLVYAPQIPNLLSLDPTTDPFKSLANLSFGTEVEVQLGRHLKASVVRQVKESEMATQWTLIYQLNSKLRLVFSSIPSVDKRLLFEYSASSKF